ERHWTMAMGTPSLSIAAMVAALGASLRASILRTLLGFWMNQRVRAAPKAWAMTVAQAAPAMPQWKAKMKRGARMAFRTVPLMVETMVARGRFWERRLLAMAIEVIWKTKPIMMMPRYS